MQKIDDNETLEEIIADLKMRIARLERGAGRFEFPSRSSDPTDAENGEAWYNSTSETFKGKENGSIVTFTTS
jgi:hypothetical protein